MRSLIALFILLPFIVPGTLLPGTPHTERTLASVLQSNEELTYEVRWMSMRIGTVTFRLNITGKGNERFQAEAFIDSYEGLPFADVHTVFRGIMDEAATSRSFHGFEQRSTDDWSVLRYSYDQDKSRSVIFRGSTTGPHALLSTLQPIDTLRVTPGTHDGLSIFYFARMHAASQDTVTVQTIVQGIPGETELMFHGQRSTVSIDKVPHPIPVIRVDGTARFSGVFGLTGDFTGWFTDDDARVPVKASFGVIIGSVRMELVQWKRENWTP